MSIDFTPGPVEASMRAQAIAARRRLFEGHAPLPKPQMQLPPPLSPFDPRRIDREIADAIAANPVTVPAWKLVLSQVSEKYGIPVAMIIGASRSRQVLPARNEASYRMVMELGMSYPATGRRINRDHTTVMHAVNKHIEAHAELRPVVDLKVQDAEELREAIEKDVLRLYFDQEQSPTAICRDLGVTRARVHMIVRREVLRVREARRAS